MSNDLERFHRAFFEESFEGIDIMEQALVAFDSGSADPETINTIFRAAHSIKGGAATFGFSAVADFTHHLESLLDEARSGQRALDPATVDLLLKAVDAVRDLLGAARDGTACDVNAIAEVQGRLEAALHAGTAAESAAVAIPASALVDGYRIVFTPKSDLFRTGNEPLHILRELAALGPLQIEAVLSSLPTLAEIDPESSYLGWRIDLDAKCSDNDIRSLFAWVEDECDLEIAPRGSDKTDGDDSTAAMTGPTGVVPSPVAAQVPPSAEATQSIAGKPVKLDDSGSIRVRTDKIDALMNLVGELVITQAMLSQLGTALDPVRDEKLLNGLGQLDRQTRLLQEAVMSTRMLPVAHVFSRFPRLVRELAGKLGKQVRLVTSGDETELDKSVIEKISDPLTHLVRNSLDHGLETPELRAASGKAAAGTLKLSAAHQGGHILITVADDGHGLDRTRILAKAQENGLAVSDSMSDSEVWALIFAPGFSTADAVTDLSGRGVGMDVVRKNVQALGGQIEISSESNQGTRVTIRLPLTLAILDGMLVRVGSDIFILPLSAIIESLQPQPEQIRSVVHQGRIVRVRGEHVPLVPLHQQFGIQDAIDDPSTGILVLIEADGRKVALLVDELVGQQQVVIKSLETNYRRVRCISGATILGDGRVSLILDVGELVRSISQAAAA